MPPPPLGLRDQIGQTIAAARRLFGAHVALARLELSAVGREIGQLAGKVAAALAVLILFLGLLLPIGTILFLGEWLFGSMAWGIVHGALFGIGLALVLVLSGLRVPAARLGAAMLLAVGVGLAVAVALGYLWIYHGWQALGDSLLGGVDSGNRPLVTAIVFSGGMIGVLGLLLGAGLGSSGDRVSFAVFGLLGGVILGALLGAISAISYTLHVGVAVGVVFGLIAWIMFATLTVRHRDWEAYRNRFVPSATIDLTQETMEWIRTRMPGRKA